MTKITFKKATFVFLTIFLLGLSSYASTMELIDIPTAHTIGKNNGGLLVWGNFSGVDVKGVYSPVDTFDLAVSLKGRQNLISVYASLKWQFLQQGPTNAALGVGNDAIYAVMSYDFNPDITGHIGLGAGDLATIFAGVDYDLTFGNGAPSVKLMAEFNRGLNLGIRAQLAPAFNVSLAIKNLDSVSLGAGFKFVL